MAVLFMEPRLLMASTARSFPLPGLPAATVAAAASDVIGSNLVFWKTGAPSSEQDQCVFDSDRYL